VNCFRHRPRKFRESNLQSFQATYCWTSRRRHVDVKRNSWSLGLDRCCIHSNKRKRHNSSTATLVRYRTINFTGSTSPTGYFSSLQCTVHQCLNGCAPSYPSEHCISVSGVDTRRHLRSANRHLLTVPRFRLNTYDRRAFSAAEKTAWNSLPDFIRDPTIGADCFRRITKTYLFAQY